MRLYYAGCFDVLMISCKHAGLAAACNAYKVKVLLQYSNGPVHVYTNCTKSVLIYIALTLFPVSTAFLHHGCQKAWQWSVTGNKATLIAQQSVNQILDVPRHPT